MNSKELLKQTIEKPFERQKFRQLIADFLNDYKQKQVSLNSFYPSYSEHFNQLNLLGEYQDANGKKIHILEVELKNAHKLEYARTAQRNLISKYLKDNWLDGALVGFWTPDCSHWRFSFVELAWEFDKESKKTKKVLSPAKRYSFLIGEGEPSHTAQFQILPVLEQEKKTILEDVEKAFSVEQVTKEFYQEYRKLFDKLCKELNQNRVFQMIKETKRIDTKNFAKKLLGQIVFLYFIQKKGWLGVPINKKWGEGDRDFLTHVFEKAKREKRNFFNDYLEFLFYNTLNNPRREEVDPSYSKLFGCRIPFLNGGLFEPMKGYDWEKSLLLLNNDLFSNASNTGILDVFDRYNFTVKEDEPLEKEVAVDPEMLGKVFENLLEENLRKGKGTYYTPREIVHYMCQESLISHLITESKIDGEKIRTLVTRDMVLTKEDIKKAMRNEKTKKRLSNRVLTFWEEDAKRLEEILKDIKVVDPACGSGAFLVGMLQEIVKARQVLQLFTDKEFNEYKLKKETIQSCIYGVDIDPGAIEIAKLRLWLSLVVDYELEEIEPLPNLDYKVMQGNSLLEELILGDTAIKLFDPNLVINEKKKMKNLFEEEKQEDLFEGRSPAKKVMKKLDKLRKKYFRISDLSEKLQVKKQIEDIEQNLVKECIDKEIKKLDIQRKNIGKYVVPGIGMTEKDAKRLAKTLSTQATIMGVWQEFRESGVRPFFLWHLYFADVFEQKDGFDVVIANPPYVRQEKIKDQKNTLQSYEIFNSTSDLYTYFYERSYNILKNEGVLTFISSNKWMRAKYGEKLRRFFKEKTTLKKIIDFNGYKVFDATVDTNILLFQKEKPLENVVHILNIQPNFTPATDITDYFKSHKLKMKQSEIDSNCFTFGDETVMNLKKKIEQRNIPLRDWDVRICFGIKTGFNKAFIIDTATKEKLCKEDPKSSEVIKPILRGRDIYRYRYKWAGLWLIKIESRWTNQNRGKKAPEKFFEKSYPAVYRHLKTFGNTKGKGKGLYNRDDQGDYWWELRDCDYYGEFEKEKLVYRDVGDKLSFAYENGNFYGNNTVYFINSGSKFLLAILNSSILNFYYTQISSQLGHSASRAFTIFIEQLPIPKISRSAQKPFIDLVNKILANTKDDEYLENSVKQAKVRSYEKNIDALVFILYGLTEEEIKIIEEQYEG